MERSPHFKRVSQSDGLKLIEKVQELNALLLFWKKRSGDKYRYNLKKRSDNKFELVGNPALQVGSYLFFLELNGHHFFAAAEIKENRLLEMSQISLFSAERRKNFRYQIFEEMNFYLMIPNKDRGEGPHPLKLGEVTSIFKNFLKQSSPQNTEQGDSSFKTLLIEDISATGIGCLCPVEMKADYKTGQVIENVYLLLNQAKILIPSLIIRHAYEKVVDENLMLKLGCSFEGVDEETEKLILHDIQKFIKKEDQVESFEKFLDTLS